MDVTSALIAGANQGARKTPAPTSCEATSLCSQDVSRHLKTTRCRALQYDSGDL